VNRSDVNPAWSEGMRANRLDGRGLKQVYRQELDREALFSMGTLLDGGTQSERFCDLWHALGFPPTALQAAW